MYLQLFPIEDNFSRIPSVRYIPNGRWNPRMGKKGEFAIHLTFLMNRLVNKINSTYLTL